MSDIHNIAAYNSTVIKLATGYFDMQ